MAFIGKQPTPVPLTASDITDGIISTAKLADTSVTNAKLNADLISGETELATAPADTDEFLISDAGVLKRLDASLIGGSGKLLQVATDFDSQQLTISSGSTTYADTGLSISFTPTAADSSLLIFACLQIYTDGNGSYYGSSRVKILHDGSTVDEEFQSLSDNNSGAFSYFRTHIARVSSTSNTNARDIKVQINIGGNANNPTVLYNQYGGKSSLIIQEIGA